MCGIFGSFSHRGIDPDPRLVAASEVAAHRGPDGSAHRWFRLGSARQAEGPDHATDWQRSERPHLLLCHRRLAIIDLSDDGLQPMESPGGGSWVSFNGEIYNFIEIREKLQQLGVRFRSRSDTEVILAAYETWGLDAFRHLAGMWALALFDARTGQVILCRDRYGIKPLHYVEREGTVTFASEIKQLQAVPGASRQVNETAVYDYLQYEATDVGDETFFRGTYRVKPGHLRVYCLRTGEVSEHCYYAPHTAEVDIPATPAAAAERFRELFKDSIRLHLRSDVPVGTCLSGGLDSSSIAMLMREIAADTGVQLDRHAFSCEFDIPEADEREYTAQAIKAAEVKPHYIQPTGDDLLADLGKMIWHQDEPFGSTSIFAQWSVFKRVREAGVKVVLDGQGADEMLGGYASTVPYFFLEQQAQGNHLRLLAESRRWASLQGKPWLAQIPDPRAQRLARFLSPPSAPPEAEQPWLDAGFAAAQAAGSIYVPAASHQAFGHENHFSNVLHRFFYLTNLPSLLRYEDRNSMAFSVEARVPFLDHRLVDYAFALPSHFKMRGGYTKRVLRDAMKGTLPEPIRMRALKMGFATPERRWQAGPLRPLVDEALHDPRLAPYVERKAAMAHLERVRSGQTFSFAPWRWLNLSRWMQEFNLS